MNTFLKALKKLTCLSLNCLFTIGIERVPHPYVHFALLFPFLLHYYKRKEMPRQINSVKITLR